MAVPDEATLARQALAGEVDVLFALEDYFLAYKWLGIALDHGVDGAMDALHDLIETSELRYDDDRFVQGAAHFEVATAYLRESFGLRYDRARVKHHLDLALCVHDVDDLARESSRRLSVEAATAGVPDDRASDFIRVVEEKARRTMAERAFLDP